MLTLPPEIDPPNHRKHHHLRIQKAKRVPQWAYQEGKNFKRFFFRMTKIKGVKNWYCSLEMKEKFGMRPLAATS